MLALFLMSAALAHADAGADLGFQNAPLPTTEATLIVEETPDGRPGRALIAAKPRDQLEKSGWDLRVTKGVFTGYDTWSLLVVGGRLGVATRNGVLEVGTEAQLGFTVWPAGVAGGTYVRLAPIPGDIGRRFYLYGRTYAAYVLQTSAAVIAEGGLGVKTYIEDNGAYGGLSVGLGNPIIGKAWMCAVNTVDCRLPIWALNADLNW